MAARRALPPWDAAPHELGLERLRKEYGLEPVEYPTTRTNLLAYVRNAGIVGCHGATVSASWADPATFDAEPETRPGTGWTWLNTDRWPRGAVGAAVWRSSAGC